MSKEKIVSGVVLLIGLYMVAANMGSGFTAPPVLSGIAFILLGVKAYLR